MRNGLRSTVQLRSRREAASDRHDAADIDRMMVADELALEFERVGKVATSFAHD